MKASQLRDAIIHTYEYTDLRKTENSINMIIETACTESNCGEYLKQVKGPACSIFQIEPRTARDLYTNFIQYRSNLKHYYDKLFNDYLTLEENLCYNLMFAIFVCRCFYLRIKEPIPSTTEERAKYWKKYYNTELGKGTVEGYIEKVKRYGKL